LEGQIKYPFCPKVCHTARDLVRYQLNFNLSYHEFINVVHGLQIYGMFIWSIYTHRKISTNCELLKLII
jgi:hypothetical protein